MPAEFQIKLSQQYEPTEIADVFKLSVEEVKNSLFTYAGRSVIYEYEIGCLLLRVKEDSLWRKPELCRAGIVYPNFSSWVYGELGFSSRKGRFLIFIVRRLLELKATKDQIRAFMSSGWAKAYHVLRVVKTLEDAAVWFGKASEKSERQMVVEVQVELDRTQNPTKIGRETRHVAVKFKNKEDYSFFSTAIGVTEKRYGTHDLGEIVSLWAAYYVATKPAGDGDASLVDLPVVIEAIEKTYGVKVDVREAEKKKNVIEQTSGSYSYDELETAGVQRPHTDDAAGNCGLVEE